MQPIRAGIIVEIFPTRVTTRILDIRIAYKFFMDRMKDPMEFCSDLIKLLDSNESSPAKLYPSVSENKLIQLTDTCRSFLAIHESLTEMYNEGSICFGRRGVLQTKLKDVEFAVEFYKDKMVCMKCIDYLLSTKAEAYFSELSQLRTSITQYKAELVADALAEGVTASSNQIFEL